MVLGKKMAIFDREWGQIRHLEKGRKSPALYMVSAQWGKNYKLNSVFYVRCIICSLGQLKFSLDKYI